MTLEHGTEPPPLLVRHVTEFDGRRETQKIVPDRVQTLVSGQRHLRRSRQGQHACDGVVDAVGPVRRLVSRLDTAHRCGHHGRALRHGGGEGGRRVGQQVGRVQRGRVGDPGRGEGDAMKRVADEEPAHRRRGLHQRPAHDADRDALRAENAPERARAERGGRQRLLDEKAEAHEAVREAIVGQELHGSPAAGHLIDARRAHAVLLRQLAGRHRRPHGFRRRGMQRGQMPHRTRIQDSAEIRQPAFGGDAGNQVQRRRVDRNHRDPRSAIGPRGIRRPVDWPRLENCDRSATAHRQRRRHRGGGDESEDARPDAPRIRQAPPQEPQRRAQHGGRRDDERAAIERLRRRAIEDERERPQIPPHEHGARRGRQGAHPAEHVDAHPGR